MEPAAEIHRGRPAREPRPEDHPALPGSERDRQVEGLAPSGNLEDDLRAPGKPLPGRRDRGRGGNGEIRPEPERELPPFGARLDHAEPPEGKARRERGEREPEHPLPHDRDPVADPRGAVEEEVHPGLEVGEERGALVGNPGGNPQQFAHRGREDALVRDEGEDARPRGGRVGWRIRAERLHHPHRGVAVGEREAEGASGERRQGVVAREPRIELAPKRRQFAPDADGGDPDADERLPRARLGNRTPAHPDLARRLEPDREPPARALAAGAGHRPAQPPPKRAGFPRPPDRPRPPPGPNPRNPPPTATRPAPTSRTPPRSTAAEARGLSAITRSSATPARPQPPKSSADRDPACADEPDTAPLSRRRSAGVRRSPDRPRRAPNRTARDPRATARGRAPARRRRAGARR